jgi:hypothetical protein
MIPIIIIYAVIFIVVTALGVRMVLLHAKFEREMHVVHAVSMHPASHAGAGR